MQTCLQPLVSSFDDHAHTVHDLPQCDRAQLVRSETVPERLQPVPEEMAGADGFGHIRIREEAVGDASQCTHVVITALPCVVIAYLTFYHHRIAAAKKRWRCSDLMHPVFLLAAPLFWPAGIADAVCWLGGEKLVRWLGMPKANRNEGRRTTDTSIRTSV